MSAPTRSDYGQTLFGATAAVRVSGVPGLREQAASTVRTFYDNRTQRSTIESKAIYGEVYWDAIPNSLKFTLGLRGTEDIKDNQGRITIFNGYEPLGSKNADAALALCNAASSARLRFRSGYSKRPVTGQGQLFENTHRKFDKLTGRFVVDYNPHWDLTDSTFLYASYARGYKAGGSNPGVQQGNLAGIPATYEPETIDAYEIGAKNTLLDGTAAGQPDGVVLQLWRLSDLVDHRQHLGQHQHQGVPRRRGRRVPLGADRPLAVQPECRLDPVQHRQHGTDRYPQSDGRRSRMRC